MPIGQIATIAKASIGQVVTVAKASIGQFASVVMGVPIDVGYGAVNGAYTNTNNYTYICQDNPANETGTLTTMEFWFNATAGGVQCGTFYGSGTSYTSRDVETLGTVSSGSKQTFSGLNCDVSSGDFLGIHFTSGTLERDDGTGNWYKAGNQFGAGAQTYSYLSGSTQCIYATGST